MKLNVLLLFKHLDKIFAISLFVLGIIFIFLNLLSIISIINIYLIIIILIVFPLIFIYGQNNLSDEMIFLKNNYNIHLNEIVFVICLIIAIITFPKIEYPYSIYYFVILFFLGFSIILSIFQDCKPTSKINSLLIIKIIILGLVIRTKLFYEFPNIYGIDPIFHSRLSQSIIESGTIPTTGEFYSYQFYPILHLTTTITEISTSLSTRNSMFISLSILPFIISILFIYILTKEITNDRIGLIASFIFCVVPLSIRSNVSLIPNFYGLVFFILLLYLCISKNFLSKPNFSTLILFIPIWISCIFTHIYPPLIFIVFVFIIFLSKKIIMSLPFLYEYNKKIGISFSFGRILPLLVIVYVSHVFIIATTGVVSNIVLTLLKNHSFVNTTNIINNLQNPINIFYNSFATNLILGFVILGILSWINLKKINKKKYIILMTFVSIFIFYMLGSITKLSYLPYRLRLFYFAPAAIIAAIGIIYFQNIINFKFNKKSASISILIISLIFFTSITSTDASLDSGIFSEGNTYRSALTESETISVNYMIDYYKGHLKSDHYVELYVRYNGYLEVYFNMTSSKNNNILLIRNYYLQNAFLRDLSAISEIHKIRNNTFFLESQADNWNVLYANGETRIFKEWRGHLLT